MAFVSTYIMHMRGTPTLSIRQRLIFPRLAALYRPIGCRRIEAMLGGLINRQTIAANLHKLRSLGLADKRDGGWVALQPSGEIAKEFVLKSAAADERWHRNYASWRCPLPAEMPFPNARNATERYCAYWLLASLETADKDQQSIRAKRLAALLGVGAFTARKIIMSLRDAGLIVGDTIAEHLFVLQARPGKKEKKALEPDALDALDLGVNRLTRANEIHRIIASLIAGNYMFRGELYIVIGDALRQHRKNRYPGDGSALVLDWLAARLRTRQGIEAGTLEKLKEDAQAVERQRAAIAKLEQEQAIERATPNIYDLIAAKMLPGENCKPSLLRMFYTRGELEAASPKIETQDGLTNAALRQVVRPASSDSVKTKAVVTASTVGMATADNDARVMDALRAAIAAGKS